MFDRVTHCRAIAKRNITHGASVGGKLTPEYRAWANIKSRCTNPKALNFQYYGGRGISIARKWANSFQSFLSNVGIRPSAKHTIERIDNSKGYIPGNVRWIIHKENCRNTRKTKYVTYNGKTQCVSAWAEEIGVSVSTLYSRLFRYGLPVERSLNPKKIKPGPKKNENVL